MKKLLTVLVLLEFVAIVVLNSVLLQAKAQNLTLRRQYAALQESDSNLKAAANLLIAENKDENAAFDTMVFWADKLEVARWNAVLAIVDVSYLAGKSNADLNALTNAISHVFYYDFHSK